MRRRDEGRSHVWWMEVEGGGGEDRMVQGSRRGGGGLEGCEETG